MTPADQRHVDRAHWGRALTIQAFREDGHTSLSLDALAQYLTEHGLPADSNDAQVWAAMLRCEGRIVAVSRTGPVRYALAGRAS